MDIKQWNLNESKIIFLGHLYHKYRSKVFYASIWYFNWILFLFSEDQIGIFIFNVNFFISYIFFRFFSPFLRFGFPLRSWFFGIIWTVDEKIKTLSYLNLCAFLSMPYGPCANVATTIYKKALIGVSIYLL